MPQRGKLMDLVNEFDEEQLQENISAENRAETTLEMPYRRTKGPKCKA